MTFDLRYLLGLSLLALLAACVSPRYQTAYRYESPNDDLGRACLQQCEPKLSGCKTQCGEKYQACVKSVEPQVDARFEQGIQQYQRDFQFYQYAFDQYQRRQYWGYYPYDLRYGSWPFFYDLESSFPPTPPRKPSREHIAAQWVQQQCDRDCGCEPIYDTCFLSCGGKKIPETTCVAHCPPEK